MYRWYQASAVCYAYLGDVPGDASSKDAVEQQIMDSVWFTRGWTLQELLAAPNIRFYNRDWKALGTKQTLGKALTKTTGIDEDILSGNERLGSRSIAQRMSWASKRKTTRREDRAYCLLGIFDVNMPLLYGEGGKKAFLRIQEEIIKQSDEHTIFAWSIHRPPHHGLLADKPKAFERCQLMQAYDKRAARTSYSMTNRGLSIKLLAIAYTMDTYLVCLDCANGLKKISVSEKLRVGIFLRRRYEDDQFARVEHEGTTFVQLPASTWNFAIWLEFKVRQQLSAFNTPSMDDRINGFRIITPEIQDASNISAFNWDSHTNIMTMNPGDFGVTGMIDLDAQSSRIKLIRLGFDFSFHPMCFIADRWGLRGYGPVGLREWPHMTHMGIHQNPFDTSLLSNVERGGVAMEWERGRGLWVLKGDRLNGLDVRLTKGLENLRIKRGVFEGKVVWEVHLDLGKRR